MISQLTTRYVLALIYGLALVYVYGILSDWWGYFGFTYLLESKIVAYLACIITAIPVLLLPAKPDTIAQVTGWILYILVFVPCMLVPLMQESQGQSHAFVLFLAVFVGAIVFMLIARGPAKRIRPPAIPPQLFWIGFGALWAVMMGVTVYGFGAQLRFAGVEDLYDQRFASASVTSNPVIRYSLMFCANAFNPFLIAYGVHTRRWGVMSVGIGAQILLYTTVAFRATLLSPVFILGVFFLFDRQNRFKGNIFLSGLVMFVVLLLPLMTSYDPLAGIQGNVLTLVYLRTLLISGSTFGIYDNFFAVYPPTYFSNSIFVRYFIPYPYGDYSIGQVVGLFLVPSTNFDIMELNANFIATDGIASIGIVGVPFMCAVLAGVLRLLSKFIPPERTPMAVAAMMTFIINLSNVSMLTSLLTGGGLFVTALAFLCPTDRGKLAPAGRHKR